MVIKQRIEKAAFPNMNIFLDLVDFSSVQLTLSKSVAIESY